MVDNNMCEEFGGQRSLEGVDQDAVPCQGQLADRHYVIRDAHLNFLPCCDNRPCTQAIGATRSNFASAAQIHTRCTHVASGP